MDLAKTELELIEDLCDLESSSLESLRVKLKDLDETRTALNKDARLSDVMLRAFTERRDRIIASISGDM